MFGVIRLPWKRFGACPIACTPRDHAALLAHRRSIAGTRSGGIAETQEMLDFCAAHGIGAEVETIGADDIDAACTRLLAGDVRFRFAINAKAIGNA